MRVAVVPARGGSKRIPKKNIRMFCGRPIIAWSIQAALDSGCFDRVLVSTDDPEIAEVSRRSGAEVPFVRPASLSDDYAGTGPVVAHAAEVLGLSGEDLICCVYATAPFVRGGDLRNGLEVLQVSGADFAFAVTSFPFPIQRAIRIREDGRVEMFDASQFGQRSQDLEEAWHDAGQFYWGKVRAWKSVEILFSAASAPVPIPRHRVQDIDTEEDWVRAELLFRIAGDPEACS